MKLLLRAHIFLACVTHAGAIEAPGSFSYLCPAPYNELNFFWDDLSGAESGFRIESRTDGGAWSHFASTGADATSLVSTGYDRSVTTEFRVLAFNATETSDPSATVRVVGTTDPLEVYPEIPGIRSPQDHSIGGITFSEMQDQCPAEPSKGKRTRVSTMYSIQVRPASGGA